MIHGILRPIAGESLIFSTAVIYPVVKVHRRSGSASAGLVAVVRSSCPLVGELTWSARVRGHLAGSRTRDDGSRTSLRTVDGVARGTRWVVPGMDPDYSIAARVAAEVRGVLR